MGMTWELPAAWDNTAARCPDGQAIMLIPQERIVVLEDDAGLRITLCEALKDEGYAVTGAAAGGYIGNRIGRDLERKR